MSVLRHSSLALAVAAAMTVWSGCGGSGVSSGDNSSPEDGEDEESCCFVDCPEGQLTTTNSFGGTSVTQADCDEAAQDPDMCGGVVPIQTEFMAGCVCPGWDEPNECVPPEWAD